VSRTTHLVAGVDGTLGRAVDRVVCSHHRRRLRRVGWEQALDGAPGGWADGYAPPRTGNRLEVLVDGAKALPRMAAEMERARSHVHVAGWFFSPEFTLTRSSHPTVLRNLLAELAERVDVRVLAWAGAPLPLFRPTRRQVGAMRDELRRGSRIRCALDGHERPMHCHHEKTIVVDDRLAFVGGIDLTLDAGDRFDSSTHPPRAELGWHDATTVIEGPAAADVADHFRLRWRETTGERLEAAVPAPAEGDLELQIARTVPNGVYRALPRGEFGILDSYLRALRSAQRLIYLENQFLWSQEIVEVLVAKLRDPPADDFRLLVVLPARPNNGADETRGQLSTLVAADDGAGRFLACTLYAHAGALCDPVYVHAKIGIVDDRWLTVGSANLNEHSLFNDTEMNVVCHDPALARATRLRLWSEHLELPQTELESAPAELVDRRWRPVAREQLERRQAGRPLTRRVVELPGVSRHSKRLLGPIDGLFVDG
jgi:phosphatidylserine/phosphatidylglycerophosphate/cardiolipin synthase-like enzyme